MYGLGLDLGESAVRAAVLDPDGVATVEATGPRGDLPTLAAAGDDRTLLVGDEARDTSDAQPHRAVDAVFRALAAPAGRSPRPDGATAEILAALADRAVATVSARRGAPPSRIVLTCPASAAGPRRTVTDQLAARLGAAPDAPPVLVVDTPTALAAYATAAWPDLAATDRRVLAVLDLGAGSCHATVLRADRGRFGVVAVDAAAVGGLDLDDALVVLARDRARPDVDPSEHPDDDPDETIVVAREQHDAAVLRRRCRAAREDLSEDGSATVAVPGRTAAGTAVVTRTDLEGVAHPLLRPALVALRRALAAAGVETSPRLPVLLVGGLSRMPLVARMAAAEAGRPVFPEPGAVDHAAALGAALLCGQDTADGPTTRLPAGAAGRIGSGPDPRRPDGAPRPAGAPDAALDAPPWPGRDATPWRADRPGRRTRRPTAVVAGVVVALALGAAAWVGLAAGRDGTVPGGTGDAAAAPAAPAEGPPVLAPGPTDVATARATPALGAPVADVPGAAAIAASPDGRVLYVASPSRREVVTLDTADPSRTTTIPLPAPPRYLTVTPDARRLVVTMWEDGGAVGTVTAVDTVRAASGGVASLAGRPFAPAVTPDGASVWVPEHEAGRVTVLDARSGAQAGVIDVGASPHAVAFSPDGTRAYVTLEESDEVLELDTASRDEVSRVPTGRKPYLIAVHPTRPLAAVTDYEAASVTVLDTRENRALATVATGAVPQGVAWSPDGRVAYVVNSGDGTVSVLDADTLRVTATVPVPGGPTGLVVGPDGRRGYLTAAEDGGVVHTIDLAGP